MKKVYYSIREVADIFGISLESIKNLEKEGVINSIRLGNGRNTHRRFSLQELTKIDPNIIDELLFVSNLKKDK